MGFLDSLGSNKAFWQGVDDIYQASGMAQFYGQDPAVSAKKAADLKLRYPGSNSPSAVIDAVVKNASASGKGALIDFLTDSSSSGTPRWSDYLRLVGGHGSGSGANLESTLSPSALDLDYLNADLASAYGMSPETAYQEALSNTAYQRAVKDMQAAGLNPAVLFGSGRASPAGSVGFATPLQVASEDSSGGSGSSRRSRAGSRTSSKYLFSEGAYGAISAAAGLVGIAATKSPTGFWIGSATAKGIMGAINSIFKK